MKTKIVLQIGKHKINITKDLQGTSKKAILNDCFQIDHVEEEQITIETLLQNASVKVTKGKQSRWFYRLFTQTEKSKYETLFYMNIDLNEIGKE